MTNDTKEAALKYAAIGIAVFPVIPPMGNEKSSGKKPYISNWQNEATTSEEKIVEWWTKWPTANIGIATGRKSDGLVVIDLDIDDNKGINGYEVLKEWQREHGNLPETSCSKNIEIHRGQGIYGRYAKDKNFRQRYTVDCCHIGAYRSTTEILGI